MREVQAVVVQVWCRVRRFEHELELRRSLGEWLCVDD